jgi:peptide/nickel transport system permease protein
VDGVTVRLIDAFIAFPFMVLVIAVVAIMGPGLSGVYIGVLAVGWTLYARLTRGEMLVLREQQFILAARSLGYSTGRIILRHAMPNLIRSNLVFSMADIVLNLLLLAGLSYLGLGVQAPTPELGAMVAEGQQVLLQAWWVTTLPGAVIVLLGSGFSMVGDAVADRLGQRFGVLTA